MLKLRTKTSFNVPFERTTTSAIVRMIVESITFDVNNSTVIGYYYYYNENDNVVKLDDFKFITSWTIINAIENNILEPITYPNIKDIVLLRLQEFTMLQLQVENGKNYGTNDTDWEIDN